MSRRSLRKRLPLLVAGAMLLFGSSALADTSLRMVGGSLVVDVARGVGVEATGQIENMTIGGFKGGVQHGKVILNDGSQQWKLETLGPRGERLMDLSTTQTAQMLRIAPVLSDVAAKIFDSGSSLSSNSVVFQILAAKAKGARLQVQVKHPDFEGRMNVTLSKGAPRHGPVKWTTFKGRTAQPRPRGKAL